jgi:hypothetical protein
VRTGPEKRHVFEFNDADPWHQRFKESILSAMEAQGRDFLAPLGLLPFFEQSKTMDGFRHVHDSLGRAAVSYMGNMWGQKLLSA